jgi:hypothetical protein
LNQRKTTSSADTNVIARPPLPDQNRYVLLDGESSPRKWARKPISSHDHYRERGRGAFRGCPVQPPDFLIGNGHATDRS